MRRFEKKYESKRLSVQLIQIAFHKQCNAKKVATASANNMFKLLIFVFEIMALFKISWHS